MAYTRILRPPVFRRAKQYVAVAFIRLTSDIVLMPGTLIDNNKFRLFQRMAWFRRGLIGEKDHDWSKFMIEKRMGRKLPVVNLEKGKDSAANCDLKHKIRENDLFAEKASDNTEKKKPGPKPGQNKSGSKANRKKPGPKPGRKKPGPKPKSKK